MKKYLPCWFVITWKICADGHRELDLHAVRFGMAFYSWSVVPPFKRDVEVGLGCQVEDAVGSHLGSRVSWVGSDRGGCSSSPGLLLLNLTSKIPAEWSKCGPTVFGRCRKGKGAFVIQGSDA